MDVYDKSALLIGECYKIRKNTGLNVNVDQRYKSFVAAAGLVEMQDGVRGISNSDLLKVMCAFLNSVFIRCGKPILYGNEWDMAPSYIFGFTTMGTDFTEVWGKNGIPRYDSIRYVFHGGATREAGVPFLEGDINIARISDGVQLSKPRRDNPFSLPVHNLVGTCVIRPVDVYFGPVAAGGIAFGDTVYAPVRFAPTVNFQYTPDRGVTQEVYFSQPFKLFGGNIIAPGPLSGVFNIHMALTDVNQSNINTTVDIEANGILGGVNLMPRSVDFRGYFGGAFEARVAEFFRAFGRASEPDDGRASCLNTMNLTLGTDVARVLTTIKEQLV